MAILIDGMECRLCSKPMNPEEETICFSAFVSNANDLLYSFSDACFHAACFLQHPLAEMALARHAEAVERLSPGHRTCAVCSNDITDPDDYFALGYLTSDEAEPVYAYQYLQLHRSHLADWPERLRVLTILQNFRDTKAWGGTGLDWAIDQLSIPEREPAGHGAEPHQTRR